MGTFTKIIVMAGTMYVDNKGLHIIGTEMKFNNLKSLTLVNGSIAEIEIQEFLGIICFIYSLNA